METNVSSLIFFPFLNGISIVVDLKASFFCKVWIKDVSHVSFLKRYWIVLLMCKSWILWWCYVCYIVFTFAQYIFPPHNISITNQILCRNHETLSWWVDWRSWIFLIMPRRMKDWELIGGKVPASLVSVKKRSAQGCYFFSFSYFSALFWMLHGTSWRVLVPVG